MRSPETIDEICENLKRIWKKHPSLRLGQLILNAAPKKKNDAFCMFYWEDDDLIKQLDKIYN